jgi:hypothetical protein
LVDIQLVKLKYPRTTNSLEGYHRHLTNYFSTLNSSLFKLGKDLLVEINFNNKKLIESHINFWSKKSKANLSLINSRKFQELYDIEYLIAVNFVLKFSLNI